MRVRVTEQRVEYLAREYEIEVPDDTDLDDFDAVHQLIVDDDLDDEDWETVNVDWQIASLEKLS